MYMQINYIAIIVVSIIQLILGAVWYGPLFGKLWMKIMGADHTPKHEMEKMQKQMRPYYFMQLVLSIITNIILYYNIIGWSTISGPIVAIALWVGFVAPTQIASIIWGSTPKKFWLKQILIMTLYQLIMMVLAGWVFMVWN